MPERVQPGCRPRGIGGGGLGTPMEAPRRGPRHDRPMTAPEIHREEFIHLVDLTHERVLVAWGAFFFERQPSGRWEIVDDDRLPELAGRTTCIGERAEPFGTATVQLLDLD